MTKEDTKMKLDKSITITAIIAAVVLIVAFMGYSAIASFNPVKENTVDVNGLASVEVEPDLVAVYFNSQHIADTSEDAASEIAEITSRLQVSLDDLGLGEMLTTQGYSLQPNYVWTNGKQSQEGYIATQTLKVELTKDQFSLADEVIDAGVRAGAAINYVSYELSQELQSTTKAEAIKLASQDAKLKASALAEGLDKKVGDVVTTSVDNYAYYPWRLYEASGVAEDASLAIKATANINPSDKEVSASVRVTFELD